MTGLLVAAARVPVRVAVTGAVTTVRVVRRVGPGRVALVALGVGIGLLVAPRSGRQLRASLVTLVRRGSTSPHPPSLAEQVRYELAHSPRTWHLPQPRVTLVDGRVTLAGTVPHQAGRDELGRAAASVRGVASVDNRIVVAG